MVYMAVIWHFHCCYWLLSLYDIKIQLEIFRSHFYFTDHVSAHGFCSALNAFCLPGDTPLTEKGPKLKCSSFIQLPKWKHLAIWKEQEIIFTLACCHIHVLILSLLFSSQKIKYCTEGKGRKTSAARHSKEISFTSSGSHGWAARRDSRWRWTSSVSHNELTLGHTPAEGEQIHYEFLFYFSRSVSNERVLAITMTTWNL